MPRSLSYRSIAFFYPLLLLSILLFFLARGAMFLLGIGYICMMVMLLVYWTHLMASKES